jgi:signal peptidase II
MTHLNRWLAAGIVLLVAADWATKWWLISRVPLGGQLEVVDGWFYLLHRQNTGVAFSMFSGLPQTWGAPLLTVVTLLSLGLFVWMLRTTHDGWSRVAIGLVIAGAIGNLGDRVLNGSVTDFVYVTFFPYVFNVADSAITVGGVLLGLRLLFGPDAAKQPSQTEPAAG